MNLINKSEKIFVAGHNGMAGKAICRALIKKGYGQKELNGELITETRKSLNLLDQLEVSSWFEQKKPTIVILAAAKVGGIGANNNYPADFLLENIKIQTNVIESAFKTGVKRLLFLGSSCIYPKFCNQPISEEELLSGTLEPTNDSYAIAKIAGIKLCEGLREQYGFDTITLMPTNLYGPGDNYSFNSSHVFAALIRRFYEAKIKNEKTVNCWGTGSPMREFLHVDDLGEAVLFALEKWDPDHFNSPKKENGDKLYYLNVGTGKDISIKDLAESISSKFGFNGEIYWEKNKPDGTPRKLLNVEKMKKIGWESKIELEDGIKKTCKIFSDNYTNGSLKLD
ncbi:GDP-L-fucose synthase [Prochlorococcus marinus XMU1406]|uniref:GDP-L-fucose synthase family protein n=1 Tax=Prochlorococcus marinus TaxID=1219 RepID=UPI001ADB2FE7|nr:GDP-L-fucose synthase [Prochlorococcus marinus]MBO8206832.1 GDP-L-fucose synthase [Prochlorococcus marinus XMU1406]MCR8542651.1 GDP-L-fucose synthase [Prochlorococcus marinus XMU1427]